MKSPKPRKIHSPGWLFRLFRKLEEKAGRAQGKGYYIPHKKEMRKEIDFILKCLGRTPGLAIDIGANIGDYTAELRHRFSALEIHAFEPSPENIEKLQTRFASDPKITIMPYAVSDTNGSATLHMDHPGSPLSSLYDGAHKYRKKTLEQQQIVQTRRFEDYWKNELRESMVDLMKIDIEGHEFQALQGFGDALQAIRVVQFEFTIINSKSRVFFRDFWELFQENHFDLYRITPWGLQHISRYRSGEENFRFSNYIARARNHT